jgi:hypothetical protein
MISLIGHNADLDRINNLIIHPPDHWNGIHHCELIEKITTELLKYGLRVTEFRGHLFFNNLDLYGAMAVPNGSKIVTPYLGFLNSGSQKQTLQFFYGVVDNNSDAAVVFYKFACGRRNSQEETDDEIRQGVKWWNEHDETFHHEIMQTEKVEVSQKQFDKIILETGRKRITSWSKVGRLDYQWKTMKGKSAWDLLLAFGRVASHDAR